MKNDTILFLMLTLSFVIAVTFAAMAAGAVELAQGGEKVIDWVSDHKILTALAVSEAAAILPVKAKGFIHAVFLFGSRLYRMFSKK